MNDLMQIVDVMNGKNICDKICLLTALLIVLYWHGSNTRHMYLRMVHAIYTFSMYVHAIAAGIG